MTNNPASAPASPPSTRHPSPSPSSASQPSGSRGSRRSGGDRRHRRDRRPDTPPVLGDPLSGVLRVNPSGFGFVDCGEGTSVFVPPPLLGDLLDADEVNVVPFGPDDRLTADSIELVARTRTTVCGVFERDGSASRVVPDPCLSHARWAIDAAGHQVAPGDLVVGELVVTDDVAELRVSEVVPAGDRHAQLRTRVKVRHFSPLHPAPEHTTPVLSELGGRSARRDLTDLVTLTIDADHSEDLDDALSVYPADRHGVVRVLVHISDVAEHIEVGCPADVDAFETATSVYLPGGRRPMFDAALSSDALSLLPGVDRDALTVELCIDPSGEVRAADIFESRVRSDLRLSYDMATDAITLRGANLADRVATGIDPAEVMDALGWLRTAAARLTTARAARGGLPARRVDPELALDDTGVPHNFAEQSPAVEDPTDVAAHDLIECLMVAANEAVARWLVERGLPGIFRVHEGPEPESADTIEQFCASAGIFAGLGGVLSPRTLAALDAQFELVDDPTLRTAWTLMFTPRATYSAEPGPHFGLASEAYLHFTSPIRRYADLCVHRVVKAYLAGVRDFDADHDDFVDVAEHITAASSAAADAENQLGRALWISVLADATATTPDRVFSARVTSVRDKGVRVVIENTACWAMLRFADLPGRWDLAAPGVATSDRSERLAVGDSLEVRIDTADEVAGVLTVVPAHRSQGRTNQRNGGRGSGGRSGGRSGRGGGR